MLPNFLIIGVEKGGTSWLWQNLRRHPDIFMPEEKEIHFFDKDQNWKKGLPWYEEYFSPSTTEKAIGEASPGYIISPKAPKRIKETLLPDIRLVTTIRHPVDRAYSSYRMAISKSHIKPISFDETMEQMPRFWETGLYGAQLRRYLNVFEREQILVIPFEDLQSDPVEVLADVLGFLEVDTNFRPPTVHEKHAPSRNVRYPMLNNIALTTAHVLRNSGMNALVKLGNRLHIKEFLFEWNTRKESYPPLPPEVRQKYMDFFWDDIDELERLLEIDLDHWRQWN